MLYHLLVNFIIFLNIYKIPYLGIFCLGEKCKFPVFTRQFIFFDYDFLKLAKSCRLKF